LSIRGTLEDSDDVVDGRSYAAEEIDWSRAGEMFQISFQES